MHIVEEDIRRRPQQARSRRSVDAILDATAQLLLETDPGSVTMSAIGAGAGVSKAAIYRYYPDRSAVLRALALREIEAADLSIVPEAVPANAEEARAQFAQVVDAYCKLFTSNPVMKAIWITGYTVPDVGEVGLHLDGLLAETLAAHFAGQTDADSEVARRQFVLAVHLLRSAVELATIAEGTASTVLDDATAVLAAGLFR